MDKYMLDTDTVIYTMKRKPVSVKQRFNAHVGELCISTVTLSELYYGAENSSKPTQNLAAVESFAARVNVLDYGMSSARQFGQLKLELKGQLIGAYDLMIAAHARSIGLILVTNNKKEFGRVPGLRIESWVSD